MKGIRLTSALALAILGLAEAEGIRKGTLELSGMGEYAYSDDKATGPNTITRSFTLSSALSFYPGRWAFLGPVLDYSRVRTEIEEREDLESLFSATDLGLQVAFLANYSDRLSLPLPYLGGAVGLSMANSEFGEDSDAENGHFFSAFAGAKLRLSETFLMNLQPTMKWRFLRTAEPFSFGVRLGFSGLL